MAKSSRFPRIVPRLPRGDELYDLLVADRHLATICETLKVLKFITPVNTREVREAFLSGEIPTADPPFMYRHEDEDFDDLKSHLHAVPIRSDSELGHVFRRKRDELHDVLTMLQARGTSEFRERSRLLYGTTSREELEAINAWLRLPDDEPPSDDQRTARDCCQFLRGQLSRDRLHATIRMRWGLSSSAAAGETSIAVRNDATFSALEMERIYVHEAETHILRYRNGERQPFRSLFYHGFPRHSDKPGNYLHTEEGLATLQEEMAGVLTSGRRRHLALRAVAVYLMDSEGLNFPEVFEALRDEYGCDPDTSFSICERTFRGGGYTKDHIYYDGYVRVREAVINNGLDLNLLLLGKVGLDWIDLVADLWRNGQGILNPPRHLPRWLRRVVASRAQVNENGSDDSEPSGDTDDDTGMESSMAVAAAGAPLTLRPEDLEWLTSNPSHSIRRAALRPPAAEGESENMVS